MDLTKNFCPSKKLYVGMEYLVQESLSRSDCPVRLQILPKLISLKHTFDPTKSLQCQKDQGCKINEFQRQEMTFRIKASEEQRTDLTQICPMLSLNLIL